MTKFDAYVRKLDPNGVWGDICTHPCRPSEQHVFINIGSSFSADDRECVDFATVKRRALDALSGIRELVDRNIERIRSMDDAT